MVNESTGILRVLLGATSGTTRRTCFDNVFNNVRNFYETYIYSYAEETKKQVDDALNAHIELCNAKFNTSIRKAVADGIYEDCFYDSETSGKSNADNGLPKTTAEMKLQATFENWDFESTWKMIYYPELKEFMHKIVSRFGVGLGNRFGEAIGNRFNSDSLVSIYGVTNPDRFGN